MATFANFPSPLCMDELLPTQKAKSNKVLLTELRNVHFCNPITQIVNFRHFYDHFRLLDRSDG